MNESSTPAVLGHVAPLPTLVAVLAALLVGTWLTVAATSVDLGPLNLWIGLGIATAKAALVALYFMHLRWDRPFHVVVMLAAVLFLALFIGLVLLDTVHYQPELIEVPAPGSEQ